MKYIDLHIDAAVQAQLLKSPYGDPDGSKVKLEGDIRKSIAKGQADLGDPRPGLSWLNHRRGAPIERFQSPIRI